MDGTNVELPNASLLPMTGTSVLPLEQAVALRSTAIASGSCGTQQERIAVLLCLVYALQKEMLSGDARALSYYLADDLATQLGIAPETITETLSGLQGLVVRQHAASPMAGMFS